MGDAGAAKALGLGKMNKKLFTLLDLCVSSLRRGHANLLCIVPILTDDPRRESKRMAYRYGPAVRQQIASDPRSQEVCFLIT